MNLIYSVCYYHNNNKTDNILRHLKQYEKVLKKVEWGKFVLTVMIDSEEESIHKQTKKEIESLIFERAPSIDSEVLTCYNWGGTILGLWMTHNYAKGLGKKSYVAHFEEDFYPLGDWFWEARRLLSEENVYIGESIVGRPRRSDRAIESDGRYQTPDSLGDPEVWADGGFYFSNTEKLSLIEDEIGIFHKGDPNTKYDRVVDGINIGEVGFPTLIYHAGLRFDALHRKDFFSYDYYKYHWEKENMVSRCPYRSPMAVVTAIQDVVKDKVVCELGCSFGDLFPLLSRYAKEIKGIELDHDRVNACKDRFAQDTSINVTQGDWYKDPIPEADVYYFWPDGPDFDYESLVGLLMRKEDFEGTVIAAADASYKEEDEVAKIQQCNDKWGGEIRRFPFNEGDDYRQNGEFVLTVIKKKKKKIIKEKKKNLVIILSHCDTPLKIKTLKETITSLRSVGVDILLTSHIPIDLDIQDMVDYFIFDKNNPLISIEEKQLVSWYKIYLNSLDRWVKLQVPHQDHWGGVMNQIIKAADVGLSLDYDCYTFLGYDVSLKEVHLKELSNPCPTEDIVTCDWGNSWLENKKVKHYDKWDETVTTDVFKTRYVGCDFNIIKKDCFKKIRDLLSIEKYLERDPNGKRFFDVAEEYWTSLAHLFKLRFVERIEEKIQTEDFNQNHLNDLFKLFISKEKYIFYEIKEPVEFKINNEIIEIKDDHLETEVKQIEYLTEGRSYNFSKEKRTSLNKRHEITILEN